MEPLLTIALSCRVVIGAMNYDLAFEGVSQKKRIAVSLTKSIPDLYIPEPSEIFRTSMPDGKPVWVLAYISEKLIEAPA